MSASVKRISPLTFAILLLTITLLQTFIYLIGPGRQRVDAYAGNRSKAYALAYCINEAMNEADISGSSSIKSFYGRVQSSNLRFLRDDMDSNGFNSGDVFYEANVNKTDVGVGKSDFADTDRCTELAKDDSIGELFKMKSLRDESWSLNSQGAPESGKPIGYGNGGQNYNLSSYKFFKELEKYIQSSKLSEKEAYDRIKQWFEICTVKGSAVDNDYTLDRNGEKLFFKRNRSTGFDNPIVGEDLANYIKSDLKVEVESSGFGKVNCVGKTLVGAANAIKLYDRATEEAMKNANNPTEPGAGNGSNDSSGSGSGENAKSCEEQFGFSTGWIVCAALEIISNGIDVLFNFAESLLNIDAQKIYENKGLKTSWSYFRAIATFMLVAVGLVAIIGQAIGKGN